METRANYVLIGIFTLVVVAAGFLFVLWFSGGRTAEHKTFEIVFDGSVSGLSRGSSVLFNGLRVGEVKSIDFMAQDPSRVSGLISVASNTPIKKDTKARLESQGLTGGSSIALTGGSNSSEPLVPGPDGAPPIIHADRSDLQNLLDNVERLSAKADDVLEKADKLIDANSGSVTDTLKNIDTFSKALADNSSGVGAALAGVADLGNKIGPLASNLQGLSNDVDALVKAVDTAKVRSVVDNVESFSAGLARNQGNIDSLLTDAASLAKRLNDTSTKLDSALVSVNNLAKAVDASKVGRAVDDITSFAHALGQNSGNTDRMLKDASELVAKLDASADQIDGLLHSAQDFIGSPETKGALTEVGDAAKSVRALADELNARVKDVAGGLTRFTGAGLREYEALAVDGRRAIADVDHFVRSLDRNPNQLIFGSKPALPEYHGGQ
jgi:phospholipid/cholesterol/gamma-HCH transport system substrate-binding protein